MERSFPAIGIRELALSMPLRITQLMDKLQFSSALETPLDLGQALQ